MRYTIPDRPLGAAVDCGRYGSAVNGEIGNEEHLTYLRAMGVTLVESAPPPSPQIVNWYSPMFGTADGYGSSAEHMIRALQQEGYIVRLRPNFVMSSPYTHIGDLLESAATSWQTGSVSIAYTPPHPNSWRRLVPAQAAVGFSMWEDSSLPHAFDDAFREVDVIAVPSTFCRDLFKARVDELGLDVPVRIVPLGFEPAVCPPRRRTFYRGQDVFTVYHSATRSSEERKGADIAIAAFQKAFPGQDDVRLILRSRMNSFPEAAARDPRVICRPGTIDDDERARQMHEAHVLLYPSRGEGFGLIPIEAIATGLPSIVSYGSSLIDHAELYMHMRCTPAPSKISVAWRPQPEGDWHEPDVDDAAYWLHRLYHSSQFYAEQAERALLSAWLVRERWTYAHSARALARVIEEARTRRAATLAA